jgi:hypothetical protein
MPDEDTKRTAHRALVDRVVRGAGVTTPEQRARAFAHDDVSPAPVSALLDKVVTRPTQITDADVTAAKDAGCAEDQLFELVIAAALGHSTRLYEAGLAALAETAGPDEAS